MWKKCLDCIEELQTILFEHNNIFIGENIAEDSENLANTDQVCAYIWNKYDIQCFSKKLAVQFFTFTTAMAASHWALSHQSGVYLENFPNISMMLFFIKTAVNIPQLQNN